MGLSDLSKQLDDRKSSNKEQPYSMGRQTVRKARTDLSEKDFQANIKLKTMPAVKWLEVEFPKVFVEEINEYIDTVVTEKNEDYSNRLVGQLKTEKSAQLDFPLKDHETGVQFKQVLENLGKSFIQKPYGRMSSVECFEAWTVHSYAGDYNPLHDHGVHTGSGLSCIFYLKVPECISSKPEVDVPSLENASGIIDGWTQFSWGAHTMKDLYQLREQTQHVVRPREGLLVMFPCWLQHLVWPFSGEGERRTLSANFNIHDSPEVGKQFGSIGAKRAVGDNPLKNVER